MRCVIVGCGRAGSRLAQVLNTQGHRVTVVDEDATALARVEALGGRPADDKSGPCRARVWL